MNTFTAKTCLAFVMLIVLHTSPIYAQNLDSGLVVRYHFDGNVNDASGHGYYGTVGSSVVAVSDRDDKPGGAYYFDATTTAYIT